jgi:hypothetical protein
MAKARKYHGKTVLSIDREGTCNGICANSDYRNRNIPRTMIKRYPKKPKGLYGSSLWNQGT